MSKFKIGDKVKCIDNYVSIGKLNLTFNKIYTVKKGKDIMHKQMICITCDNGKDYLYNSNRFKKVNGLYRRRKINV